jgi:hypothetical protein
LAVQDQATVWKETPVFKSFVDQLPRPGEPQHAKLPRILQNVMAVSTLIETRPLLISSRLPMALSVMPEPGLAQIQTEFTTWLKSAQRVEAAHRLTVAWLRSRIPGYPSLPALQLTRGTNFTTQEFTPRLTWTSGERGREFQFQDPPNELQDALGVKKSQWGDLAETARVLASALTKSEEWIRLGEATDTLDRAGKTNLLQACATVRQRLSPGQVDDHEPNLAIRRNNYRQGVLAEEAAKLSGTAAEYTRAFQVADDLIEWAVCDVFGQLSVYEIRTFNHPQNLTFQPGDPPLVSFSVDHSIWPHINMIAWIADPLVTNAVQITRQTINLGRLGAPSNNLSARVLSGTDVVWSKELKS